MSMWPGATLFMVNSSRPKGGVIRPSCMAMRNSTPNQIGSMPALVTRGMKKGSVSSIMLTWSTKQPRISRMMIIARISMSGLRFSEPTAPRKPLVAPEKPSNCEKAVAPTMMNNTMQDTSTVPLRDAMKFCHVSAR
jgi:hypothetical protein